MTAVNSSPLGQNDLLFEYNIFRCIFLHEKFCISVEISLNFVPKGSIDNDPALVQIIDNGLAPNRRVLTIWRLLHMLGHFDPPPFSSLWKIVSTPIFSKNEENVFQPLFFIKIGQNVKFQPPFFSHCIAFRVDGWCWASLSDSWPSTAHWLFMAQFTHETECDFSNCCLCAVVG